jgi:uncharacterized membrane protein YdjX (TVP38/TMEM64 family)
VVDARRLIGLLVVAIPAAVATALLLPHSPAGLRDVLASAGPLAPAIALAVWIVLVPALFPATVLAAASGLAFGLVAGSLLAVAGAAAGGLAAFALGRFAVRGIVERWVRRSPRLGWVHEVLERRGFTAVLAARLTPGIPAGVLHYAAGASPVRARSFSAAIAIGALARTVPYALLGRGLGSGSVAMLVVAVASIALGGLAAAVLLRGLRRDAVAAV